MRWRILLFLLFLTGVGCEGISQTAAIAEKESYCAGLYSKILSLRYSDPDSAAIYSNRFEKELKLLITSQPATFYYQFPKLVDSNFCFIRVSPDKNLKIYSWDTWLDGTRHVFRTIYQWRHKSVTYSKLPPAKSDIAGFCSAIYNVFISGKSYYLVVTNAVFSDKHGAQTITAYTINNNTLQDKAAIFHTNGNALSSISINFDFSGVADRWERPSQLIVYDQSKRALYIPFIDSNNQLTQRKFIYQLTGEGFEYNGMQ